jgi:DNA helicase MCM8
LCQGCRYHLNTAIASGKTGKRASETSTYTLYMVANSIDSIVNTTADLHDVSNSNRSRAKKKKDSSGGLFFTKDQLEKITKVAHADHMMGSMSIRMAFPFDLLVRSLCPSIVGHDCVKAGILLGLLGGTPPSSVDWKM